MELKALREKKNDLLEQMKAICAKAQTETRALTEEETASYDSLKAEVEAIGRTIQTIEESRSFNFEDVKKDAPKGDKEEVELRAFANYIRTLKTEYTEERAGVNMTVGDNGAVIPETIANRIIDKVVELSPILEKSTRYGVKGNLSFPVYDESTNAITCAYHDEFNALESKVGKYTKVSLGGYLAGALAKVSNSLINSSAFDVVSHVIQKMAEAIAKHLEKELLTGATKAQGVCVGATQVVTAGSATAIVADDLVALQTKIPQAYDANGCWILNRNTLLALRKLKDGDDRYLLQPDFVNGFGYMLLGRPVYVSENMADIATKTTPIVYGDMSGLFTNFRKEIEIQVLKEKYADEHATGVVAWLEFDSKVIETQKIAVLKMA